MGRAGGWAVVLMLAAAARAQILEAPVQDGAGRVQGRLAGDLAVTIAVASEPLRTLTPGEREAAQEAEPPEAPPADRKVRLLKALTVQIGGEPVTLPAEEVASLVDVTRIRVWRQETAVYCRLLGRDGSKPYQVTFTFMPSGRGWVRSTRAFSLDSEVREESARQVRKVQASVASAPPSGALPHLREQLGKPAYAGAFAALFRTRQPAAPWLRRYLKARDGVEGPGTADAKGEFYSVCKPHDCPGNGLVVLFEAGGGRAWALLTGQGRAIQFFGEPDADLRAALVAFARRQKAIL